jgi:hypothetical protein
MHFIRWFEINEVINDNNNEITKQLKIFLKEQDMEKSKNFTLEDFVAMQTITETISKMDELLEVVKPTISKNFGAPSKESSRSTRLKEGGYFTYNSFKDASLEYWLLVGFSWWWGEEEIPHVGVSIEIPKKGYESSKLKKILDSELIPNGWEYDEYDLLYYSAVKPVTDFLTMEEDNIPAMKNYIENNLQTLLNLKEKYPNVFVRL